MKILHRYLLITILKNFGLCLSALTLLFLVVDFFDRIDNILPQNPSLFTVIEYFLFKIPLTVSLMLPVSMLVAVLFTVGMLSKNSEITAMRASGLTVAWLARPFFVTGIILSFASILLNETLVPYSQRRAREIYNLDIQQKQNTGTYNQDDLWWRNGNSLFSCGIFDSRDDTMHDFVRLDLSDTFTLLKRTDAQSVKFLAKGLGWSMRNVTEYRFKGQDITVMPPVNTEPLNISSLPQDFYDAKMDPNSMSFRQLRKFIKKQQADGISTVSYLPDLYGKLSAPFLIFIVIPLVLPFALKTARSGSLAPSFVAALLISFSYYAVHSLSLALGRAEIWPALLSAWMANMVLSAVGVILFMGTESPS